MITISDEKKRDLLKTARRQLAEEYCTTRSDEYKHWLGDCETVWRTSGNRLPLAPPRPPPTEADVVARALRLYNELVSKDPAPTAGIVKEVTATAPSEISKVISDVFAIQPCPAVAPVPAPAIVEPAPVVEPVIESAPLIQPTPVPEVKTTILPRPVIAKTECFANSIHDAPVASTAMIEKIIPDVPTTNTINRDIYSNEIYKIYQVESPVTALPETQPKQKTDKTGGLKSLLTGIFPQWSNQ